MEDETFPDAAARELAFLIEDYGFRLVSADANFVRFESPAVVVLAVFDPRGEVDVDVSLLGEEPGFGTLSIVGLVGRASMPRLLQLAAERLRTEEAALRGDLDFFDRLANDQRREAREWSAYRAGLGPRPQTGKLP